MSKVFVHYCDGAVNMTSLTALRSVLAKVKNHTLRAESDDKFGRVEEKAALLEKEARTSLMQLHFGKVMRSSAHSCLIWSASG